MVKKRKLDDIVNLKLRFTEALRARIEQEAKKNQRSLNGRRFLYRLGTTFGTGSDRRQCMNTGNKSLKEQLSGIGSDDDR